VEIQWLHVKQGATSFALQPTKALLLPSEETKFCLSIHINTFCVNNCKLFLLLEKKNKSKRERERERKKGKKIWILNGANLSLALDTALVTPGSKYYKRNEKQI